MTTSAMIGIVNYGFGNLTSVAGAVERLGFDPRVSLDTGVLGACAKLNPARHPPSGTGCGISANGS